jgi:diadenosine tetraphosphate (Ap4A) HIT family hydrolase
MMSATHLSAERIFPEGSIIDVENCLICQMEDAPGEAVVFRDDLWSCEVTPGFEVPGWFVLRVRRHALGWHDLNSSELTTFGQHAKDVVDSVAEVFGSPATYLLNFGEAYPHFHVLIAARTNDIPREKRIANIMTLRQDHLDREASLASVPRVREAYEAVTHPS